MVFSKFVSAESSDPAALALRHTDAASVLQYIAFGVRQWNPSLNMKAYIASPCAMLEFLIQQFDEVPGTLLHRDLVMCLRDIRGPPASSYYHPLDATHTLTHWSVGIVTRLRLMSFPAIPGRLSPQAYRAFICAMTVLLAIHYDPRGPTWVHLAMNNGLIRVLASARNIWPNQCPEISATLLRKVLLPYLFYYRVCVAVNAQLDWLPNLDLDHLVSIDASWAQLVQIARHRGKYTSVQQMSPRWYCRWCMTDSRLVNYVCGGCRDVYYCSQQCQSSDWDGHGPNKHPLRFDFPPHHEVCREGEFLIPYEVEPFASLRLAPIDTRYIKSFVRETILRHWKAIVEPLKKYQPSIPSLRVDLTGLVTTVALTEPSPEATRRLNGEREFRIDIVFPRPGGREPAVLNAVIIYPEPDPKEEYVPWLEEHLESLKMLQGVDFDPMLTR
ncbi:hypothetical protein PC9H_010407 [Pleurotus ostreatus]|uniref:MYND-type domain-containing protein n=1 Tax=Pleurotus ostreatus TaxID=5322 RepID=A0A8H6ZMF2_PLEOS|nr:uncharacterized protein PC9H_010407 [Pleurotus ostreatus]KAF7422251.1 hypothetical protein PC9H_010407 [Pleurotus ostreatus]KAJ8691949.1 hypothetical protein PTI98_011466 [Pleurotus ostreatus]